MDYLLAIHVSLTGFGFDIHGCELIRQYCGPILGRLTMSHLPLPSPDPAGSRCDRHIFPHQQGWLTETQLILDKTE